MQSQPLSSSDPYGLEAWYGGAWNPGNWYRGLMAGSASAPDDVYNAAMEAAGQSYVQNAGNAHAALQMGASIAPPGLSRGFEAVDQVLTGMEGPELQDAIKGNVDPTLDKFRAGVEAGGNFRGLKGGKGLGKLGATAPVCKNAGAYVRSKSPAVQRTLPKSKHGVLKPDTDTPHTQLGRSTKSHGAEPQAREWMHDSQGRLVPTRDIDFTDHNFPAAHPNPHQHILTPKNPVNPVGGGFDRGKPMDLQYP